MKKQKLALIAVITISLLHIGDRHPVGAQPLLEVEAALRIPGPALVRQQPLPLSFDERLRAQEIIWEYRMLERARAESRTRRNTDLSNREQNPLPELSAFLGDAYRLIQKN